MKKILELSGLTYLMLKIKLYFIKKPAILGLSGQVLSLDNDGNTIWSSLPTMLSYKGTKTLLSEVTSLTDCSVGDVWYVSDNSSEYVCISVNLDTTGVWELLGPNILSNWEQSDSGALDYIKNKPNLMPEPINVGTFLRSKDYLGDYSWVKGVTQDEFKEKTFYTVINTLPHSITQGTRQELFEIDPTNINGTTEFVFNITIKGTGKYFSNNETVLYYNKYNLFVTYKQIIIDDAISYTWDVRGVKIYNNLRNTHSSQRENLTAFINDNKLLVLWDGNVKDGEFTYIISNYVTTEGSYSKKQIELNNITYKSTVSSFVSSNTIITFELLQLDTVNINKSSIVYLTTYNQKTFLSSRYCYAGDTSTFNIDYSASTEDNLLYIVYTIPSLTLNIMSSTNIFTGCNTKHILVKNENSSNITVTITTPSGSTLHNMYGPSNVITIPPNKIFECVVTFWSATEYSWNGGLEA